MLPRATALFTPWSAAGLVGVLVLGAVVRLAVEASAPAFLILNDSAEFYRTGYELARSGKLDPALNRAPLYSLFLGGTTAVLGPSLDAVTLVQHVLGLGTIVLVYLLGAVVFGRGAALLAALGVALNGALLLLEQTLVSEAVYAPLLLTALLAFVLALRQGRVWLFVLAGLLVGLCALTRPLTQAALPVVLLVVAIGRSGWRPRVIALGAICLAYGLIVGPWMLRNQAVHGSAVISAGLGEALYKRVTAYDRGFEVRDLAAPHPDPRRARMRALVFELHERGRRGFEVADALRQHFRASEAEADAVMREVALEAIPRQPEQHLAGTATMFVELALGADDSLDPLWRSRLRQEYEQAWPRSVRRDLEAATPRPDADRERLAVLAGIYQDGRMGVVVGLLFLLGAVRCLMAGWQGGQIVLPLIVLWQLLLYVALDGPQARYRSGFQPLITLLAAGGLGLLAAWLASRLSWTIPWAGRLSSPARQRANGDEVTKPVSAH